MLDYMKSTPEGLSVVDFSGLTRDQTAALSQVTVEDVAGGRRAGPYSLPWCEMRLTALANPTVSSGRPQRAPVTDRCR